MTARLQWVDGQLWSERYGDVYYPRERGVDQARHVFLGGNDLAARFAALPPDGQFTIGETGFGTGLNFLCAWDLFARTAPPGARLDVLGAELHPFEADDLAAALAPWTELAPLAADLVAQLGALPPGWHRCVFADGRVTLTLLVGDARETLREADAIVDAWFLDGFSPPRNPDLWSDALFAEVARSSRPGTTCATWSVAGDVRRGLKAAGFTVKRAPGFGTKRSMLRGRFSDATPPASTGTSTSRVRTPVAPGTAPDAGAAGTRAASRDIATTDSGAQHPTAIDAGAGRGATSTHPGAVLPDAMAASAPATSAMPVGPTTADVTAKVFAIAAGAAQTSAAAVTMHRSAGTSGPPRNASSTATPARYRTPARDPAPWLRRPPALPHARTAVVIGGGLAGTSAAASLAARGLDVTLVERHATLAAEASGNPQGVLYIKPSAHGTALTALSLAGVSYTLRELARRLPADGTAWSRCGILVLAHDAAEADRHAQLAALGWPTSFLRAVDADTATAIAGVALAVRGLHYPTAGWAHPPALCAALADHPRIALRTNWTVRTLERDASDRWTVTSNAGEALHAEVVVVASALDAARLPALAHLPLKPIRGQITTVRATDASARLATVLCGESYVAPARDGRHCLGATFQVGDAGTDLRAADDRANLDALRALAPAFADALDAAAIRTPDHTPDHAPDHTTLDAPGNAPDRPPGGSAPDPAPADLARYALDRHRTPDRRVAVAAMRVAADTSARTAAALDAAATIDPDAGTDAHAEVAAAVVPADDIRTSPDDRADADVRTDADVRPDTGTASTLAHATTTKTDVAGRAAVRVVTPDYLPIVGAAVDADLFRERFAALARDATTPFDADAPWLPGLFVSTGHGSRGLVTAPIAGELIAALVTGEPLPLPTSVMRALSTARFLARELKRRQSAR